MIRDIVSLAVIVGAIATSSHLLAADAQKQQSLADAVKDFNRKAKQDEVGRYETPLTEDEVIAAIRSWDRKASPVTDDIYESFQSVAKTKQLPAGARLSFIPSLEDYNGLHFDVWFVDLTINQPVTAYRYRLRDRKIRCRPMNASDDQLQIHVEAGPPKKVDL